MAILRKAKRDKYTVIDNAVFMDNSISYKAKGLLCQMLSLPDGWQFSIEGLAALSSDGKASVSSALKELEEAGYLRREQIKEDGRYAGVDYIVSETKFSDFPYPEIQLSENQPQLNTKESITKEYTPPTVEEIRQYVQEKNLMVDADYFYEYYEDKHWTDKGGDPVKNWKLKCRTWHKREVKNGNDIGAGNRKCNGLRKADGRSQGEPEIVGAKLPPMAFGNEPNERGEDDDQVVSGRDRLR